MIFLQLLVIKCISLMVSFKFFSIFNVIFLYTTFIIFKVHYYFQLAQQHHANLQQNNTSNATSTSTVAQPQGTIQIVQPQVQTVQVNSIEVGCVLYKNW